MAIKIPKLNDSLADSRQHEREENMKNKLIECNAVFQLIFKDLN